MERGYVKLWRKTLDSGLLQNGPAWQLFGYLLLKATHKPYRQIVGGVVFELLPGQLVFGRVKAGADLGLSEQRIRTAILLLKKMEIITSKVTSKGTIITIVNWHNYQEDTPTVNQQGNQQPNQQVTSIQPALNQHLTTNKNKITRTQEEKKEDTASAAPAAGPPLTDSAPPEETPPPGEKPHKVKQAKRSGKPPPDEPHYRAKSGRYLTGKRLESFQRFWDAFAYPKGKAEAADAWLGIPQLTDSLVALICYAAQCEAAERSSLENKGQTPKWAQGWLNARRWEDYQLPPAQPPPAHELPSLTPEEQARARATRQRLHQERLARQGLSAEAV